MKITHYALLFIAATFLAFLGFGYYVEQVIDTNDSNNLAKQTLIASTDSALNKGQVEEELIFDNEETRWLAVEALQNIYGINTNNITEEKKVTNKYHLSTIFIVDWDGYYMEYENSYKDSSGKSNSKEEMTELNTWTETYGSYVLNYRLDENITLYFNQSKYSGNYLDIYNSLGCPSELSFMSDLDSFKEERNITIATIMNEQINYYANTKNTWFNTYNANYLITINSAYDNEKVGVMDKPCVIALSQDTQTLTYRNYTDVFAFTSSNLTENKLYYIKKGTDGIWYYHTKNCSDATDYTGEETLQGCAKKGAYPHDCIYLDN